MSTPDLGPLTGSAGTPLDQIRLTGVTARGRHGVLAHERRDGQDFVVDAVLHVDTRRAAATDDLAETVDYGALAIRIADVIRGEPVDLIEALATRIAESALAAPDCARVVAVDVTVHKPQAPITEPFADVVIAIRRERAELGLAPVPVDPVDAVPAGPVSAVLALGTNLGDREAILRAAIAELRSAGLSVDRVSPVVETDPVGGPDQPDYLNAVLLVRTGLSARELLATAHRVEAGQGRERLVRWGPRTLDIDVIRYGDLISADPELVLPHPRADKRAFVLLPWLAADPQAWLPTTAGPVPVASLPAATDTAGVRVRPDLRLDEPDRPADEPGLSFDGPDPRFDEPDPPLGEPGLTVLDQPGRP